ncbi:MAG: PTS sugar transporter subunit IIA [Acidobacteriota bacterium]
MRICDYLKSECIKAELSGNTRNEILLELTGLIGKAFPEINIDEAVNGLLKREKLETTGIGKGIAIPHSGIKSCNTIVPAFGLVKKDVDFRSLDNEPVKIVFLILYPAAQVSMQLRFLARVSRILRNKELVKSLQKCNTSDEILGVFENYENRHFT